MPDKEKQPQRKPFSTLKIILCMSVFIFMVRNEGFVNIILIVCLVTYFFPFFLTNAICKKFTSLKLLPKVQNLAQHWYESNVIKAKDSDEASSSPKNQTGSKTVVFEETETDLFNIPEPPEDDPIYPTDEEIWGNYINDEEHK